jgi:putative phage-type endonuclease
MDRQAWLEERRQGIGGSDMSDLFQIEPYGCQRRLWYDKRDQAPDFERETTGAMERGTELEDIIADKYCREIGRKVRRANKPFVSSAWPWIRANIDRVILNDDRGPGVLECKSANLFVYNKFVKEGLLEGYILQLQNELLASGYTWGAWAILHPDSWRMSIFEVLPDAQLQEAIIVRGEEFWKLVENGPSPEKLDVSDHRCQKCQFRLTCHADEIEALVMQDLVPSGVDIDPSLAPLVSEWNDAWDAEAEAKLNAEAIEDKLKEAIGDREAIDAGIAKVYYKTLAGVRRSTRKHSSRLTQRWRPK